MVENDLATLSVGADGRVESLREKATGRELAARRDGHAFIHLRDASDRRRINPVAVSGSAEDGWSFRFGDVSGEVVVAIRSFGPGWVVRVVRVTVDGSDYSELRLARFSPVCAAYTGYALPMLSDDDSGVVVYPCELEMGCYRGEGEIYARSDFRKDLTGMHVGIVAAPRPELPGALKRLAAVFHAPVSSRGGPWALESEDARKSTLFADVTEASADDWISWAQRGSFGVLHFSRWWAGNGTYEVNRWYFPNGIEGMSNVCEKVRAAGLRCGMHSMTGAVGVGEPLVREMVDELQSRCSYTLAKPLEPGDAELFVVERPWRRHDFAMTYLGNGNALRVGREIVQYSGVRREPPYAFTGLVRGAFGTPTNGVVAAGSSVGYLLQRYMSFYPQPASRLSAKVAENIAKVFRQCGMDDIYHDGAEGLGSRYAVDAVRREIYDGIGSAPLVECSSASRPHGWWFQSRLGAWDHPRWAPKRFLDRHVKALERISLSDLLPATSGWWEPRAATRVSRGHFTDEMEYYASKNAAHDFCSTIHSFDIRKGVSRYRRGLIDIFGVYERFRLERAFSDEALVMMRPEGAESRLRKDKDGTWRLTRTELHTFRADGPSRGVVSFPVASRAALRVEALYSADVGSDKAVVVSSGPEGAEFPFPYKSLGGNAAFALSLNGTGSGGTLDVRVSSPREYSGAESDHYIPLDFSGGKTATFLLRERDADRRMREDPHADIYKVMREGIDEKHVARVEFLGGGTVGIGELKAVPVVKTRQVRPEVIVNGKVFRVPFTLVSGDWVELEDGEWRHWTEDGELAGTAPAEMPEVRIGENEIAYSSKTEEGFAGRAEVTLTAFGRSVPALAEEK